jgi:Ca2+-binding RTX toxin-like protein
MSVIETGVLKGTVDDDADMFVDGMGRQDMNGGNGDDVVRGGAGDDLVRGGNGDDVVRGGSGDDDVRGGFGDDYVKGGEGNDTVNGGAGDDVMAGGSGEDVFVFDGHWGAGAGDDVVTDFDLDHDALLIRNAGTVTVVETEDGVILRMSSGGSLELLGVSAADVAELDFAGPAPELVYAEDLPLL